MGSAGPISFQKLSKGLAILKGCVNEANYPPENFNSSHHLSKNLTVTPLATKASCAKTILAMYYV